MNEFKPHQAYLEELGERLRLYRIAMNVTQKELADRSGVSDKSIVRLEKGQSVSLENLIRILNALGLAQNLEMLVPDQRRRPSYYVDGDKNVRRRARKKKTVQRMKWGDEA